MALIIRTQAPTVEIPVVSRDGSKNTNTLLVGFKRYGADAGKTRLDEYNTIVTQEGFDLSESKELEEFIKAEVVFFKDVSVETVDDSTGKSAKLRVADTRKATKLDGLWENSEQCLAVLLDSYLVYTSWRLPFISALQSALADINFEEVIAKN